MLGRDNTLQPDDLRHICPVFAKSFMQLTDVLRQKKRIESDKSHVRSRSQSLFIPSLLGNQRGDFQTNTMFFSGFCVTGCHCYLLYCRTDG